MRKVKSEYGANMKGSKGRERQQRKCKDEGKVWLIGRRLSIWEG